MSLTSSQKIRKSYQILKQKNKLEKDRIHEKNNRTI